MSGAAFYDDLRRGTESLWQAIFDHPFVKGIGEGSLSYDRYEFFLKQDYIYLIDFSRVFALASAKAHQLEDMGYFATLLDATLNMEMDLHRKTCSAFGITGEDLEATEPAMITTAYTNLLVRTCYEGTLTDILGVLLPCAIGYAEIGQKLKSGGLPENPHYQEWINTYSGKDFVSLADWLKQKFNQITLDISESSKRRIRHLYLSSARFEYLFFDMCWNKEAWPGS